MALELNSIFVIEKGNRKAKWKVIEHPNFDAFALVADHPRLRPSTMFLAEDIKHIVSGNKTLEGIYKQAYDHT